MIHLVAALAAAALVPVAAHAMGGNNVQIGSLDDILLGTWTGVGNLEAIEPHCVMRTGGGGAGSFRITISGDGPGAGFELTSGSVSLPYLVDYDDGSGWRRVAQSGNALSNLEGTKNPREFRDCEAGVLPRERLRITVTEDALGDAMAGSYSGTVILTVTPQ